MSNWARLITHLLQSRNDRDTRLIGTPLRTRQFYSVFMLHFSELMVFCCVFVPWDLWSALITGQTGVWKLKRKQLHLGKSTDKEFTQSTFLEYWHLFRNFFFHPRLKGLLVLRSCDLIIPLEQNIDAHSCRILNISTVSNFRGGSIKQTLA